MSHMEPAQPAEPPIRTGAALGRYQVQEFLGQGPHGPTYRAYDPNVARSAVIEVLETMREPEVRARLALAAPLLVRLRHPNVVDVYEVGDRDGLPYLVSGHVEGVSLGDAARGGIGVDGSLRILHAVARGVDHTHEHSVVHGDLRPATVVLGPAGRPLLREVGLVPLLDTGFRGSAFGIRTGALHYQAPEQLERGEVSAATDRYAFATMAYELLTGALPFAGQTTSEILAAKERMEPIPASTRNPLLGAATDAVLASGLGHDPALRWQSCGQMTQALEQAVADDGYRRQAYGDVEPYAPAAAPSRRRWPWVLGALAALALLAAIAIALWLNLQQRPSSPSLTLSVTVARPGDSITLSGSHLPAGQVGTIELQSSPLRMGAFAADAYGTVDQQANVPRDASPGDHVVSLCWNGSCPVGQRLTVLEPTPSPTPSPTPTPTPTATPTPTPTRTPTPAPARTPTPSASPSPGAR